MRRAAPPLLLSIPTRYAGLAQRRAQVLLALLALAALLLLAWSGVQPAQPGDGGAVALASTIVENIRHGGTYYPIAADALRSAGLPLRPFTAFALPTLPIVAAAVSPRLFAGLLALLAVAVGVAAWARLRPWLGRRRIAALLLGATLAAGLIPAAPLALALLPEIWAGLLLALALLVRRPGHWVEAAALGLAAALLSEAAAPALLLMAALAWRDGDRREAIGWALALGLFMVVLGVHAQAVARLLRESDLAGATGPGLAGPAYAIRALAAVTAAAGLPAGAAALLMLLALFGWTALPDPLAGRIAAVLILYAAMLALVARVGQVEAAAVAAPLALAGLVFAADGLRDLVLAALDGRRITVKRVVR
ncbi:hypothetical protein [Sphingomonas abaci]|uniref:DUF2029 domain-containing protein n=1 Tax=Sphingomonas abaci TaxID=237611 RepID=A0A7W7AGX9_9SPHN|nr:hypothetical protein [Sphingomonas abaci]MBB4616776.1 hypothetical protein [Sphingomonas abaci]